MTGRGANAAAGAPAPAHIRLHYSTETARQRGAGCLTMGVTMRRSPNRCRGTERSLNSQCGRSRRCAPPRCRRATSARPHRRFRRPPAGRCASVGATRRPAKITLTAPFA